MLIINVNVNLNLCNYKEEWFCYIYSKISAVSSYRLPSWNAYRRYFLKVDYNISTHFTLSSDTKCPNLAHINEQNKLP